MGAFRNCSGGRPDHRSKCRNRRDDDDDDDCRRRRRRRRGRGHNRRDCD